MSLRQWISGVFIVVTAAGISCAAVWLHNYPIHHFGIVKHGVLYRSGQPNADSLAHLQRSYHIRTVVNLRGQSAGKAWYDEEKEYCHEHSVVLVDIPMADIRVAKVNLSRFLRIATDPRRQPVLVQCEAGSARTGFAVAAYRIAVQGWSYENALTEAKRFRFNIKTWTNRQYAVILRRLAVGEGPWPEVSTAPAEHFR